MIPQVKETERFRLEVCPCYDINNKYMGYIDSGRFHDMREGWYCISCSYETESFWKALYHDIKHFLDVRKRKTR